MNSKQRNKKGWVTKKGRMRVTKKESRQRGYKERKIKGNLYILIKKSDMVTKKGRYNKKEKRWQKERKR